MAWEYYLGSLRWLHIIAGITWIGLLYYFNFVQTPSFPKFEGSSRRDAFVNLVPTALFWFRWAGSGHYVCRGRVDTIPRRAAGLGWIRGLECVQLDNDRRGPRDNHVPERVADNLAQPEEDYPGSRERRGPGPRVGRCGGTGLPCEHASVHPDALLHDCRQAPGGTVELELTQAIPV